MNLPRIFIIISLMLLLFGAARAQTVDVYGQVRFFNGTCSTGEGLNGVTVLLYDEGQTVLYTDVTHTDAVFMSQHGLSSPDGIYYFNDVPYRLDYILEVIPPDGVVLLTYPAIGPNLNDNPRAVGSDFYRCFIIVYESHTIGFWGANVKKAVTGKGHAQVSPTELNDYLQIIYDDFDSATYFPVEGVSSVGGDPLTFLDAHNTFKLSNGGPQGMINKTKKQLLALLFDVAAGWVPLDQFVSDDFRTVGEAIFFAADMIPDGDDLEIAHEALDYINNNHTVPDGWIPAGYNIYGDSFQAPSITIELPTTASIIGSFPNPFNPETSISFSLPKASDVTLSVFNLQGQKVDELVTGNLNAGGHSVIWNAASLPSGTYIYRLNTNHGVFSGKMLLLK